MRWANYISSTKFGSEHLQEKKDVGIDWKIKLNWILKKLLYVDWIHLAQDRDKFAGSCEHSIEISCSMKGKEYNK
jgi:hypothetical protein